jgi:hypothetical protein
MIFYQMGTCSSKIKICPLSVSKGVANRAVSTAPVMTASVPTASVVTDSVPTASDFSDRVKAAVQNVVDLIMYIDANLPEVADCLKVMAKAIVDDAVNAAAAAAADPAADPAACTSMLQSAFNVASFASHLAEEATQIKGMLLINLSSFTAKLCKLEQSTSKLVALAQRDKAFAKCVSNSSRIIAKIVIIFNKVASLPGLGSVEDGSEYLSDIMISSSASPAASNVG